MKELAGLNSNRELRFYSVSSIPGVIRENIDTNLILNLNLRSQTIKFRAFMGASVA